MKLRHIEVHRRDNGVIDRVLVVSEDYKEIELPITLLEYRYDVGSIGDIALHFTSGRIKFLELAA